MPNTKWGSWVGDTAGQGSTNEAAIPTERWEQLQELGLNLAHFTIFSNRLVEGSDNVALKLNHAAWVRGLSLSLNDPVLWDVSRSERRPYHPESSRDFSTPSGGQPVYSEALHRGSLAADRHNVEATGPNAIRFDKTTDDRARIAGLLRGGEIFTDLGMQGPSGYYILSLRCAFLRSDIPSGDSPVFTVELRTSKGTERFPCGADLFRTEAINSGSEGDTLTAELLLGRVHLVGIVEDGGVSMRIERMSEAGPDPGYNERTRCNEPLQMEIVYQGTMDVTLDAVYLSDERAFALMNPDHPSIKPGERDLIPRISTRMRLLGADSSASWPALKFLEFSESLTEDGSEIPARALAEMLRVIAGSHREAVRPFVWSSGASTKDSTRIVVNEASMRGIVSGRYIYPFEVAIGAYPEDPAYYDSTYFPLPWEKGGRHNWSSFQSLSDWYRQYAEARKLLGLREWMPAMQSHSWLFRNGWPVHAINDTGWLYEPNAAEFRFQCNMALCYGATALMLYQVSSWPGRAMQENIVSREEAGFGGMGAIGLLNPHDNLPRRMDTNGEDKWDSTAHFIRTALRPHGDLLSSLTWQRGYNCHALLPADRSTIISAVSSLRFVPLQGWVTDPRDRCFVEIGEFADEEDQQFLFVVNKRVDAGGQREIYLRLKQKSCKLELLPVEGVRTELVKTTAGTFILTLPPGCAVLLRVV
ncbi:MAG: hypothetical protein WBQ23_16325 [Bacteroidota bacterium]